MQIHLAACHTSTCKRKIRGQDRLTRLHFATYLIKSSKEWISEFELRVRKNVFTHPSKKKLNYLPILLNSNESCGPKAKSKK